MLFNDNVNIASYKDLVIIFRVVKSLQKIRSKNKSKIRKNKNIKNIKDLYRNATCYSNLRIAKLILLLYVLIKHMIGY